MSSGGGVSLPPETVIVNCDGERIAEKLFEAGGLGSWLARMLFAGVGVVRVVVIRLVRR